MVRRHRAPHANHTNTQLNMTDKVTGYTIERLDDFYELVDKVQAQVDKGWQPIGGVTVEHVVDSAGEQTTHYLQALVIYSDAEK